jgi:hypothetical protein
MAASADTFTIMMLNVSLLRIFLNAGLTGFPMKKSGPDPIEHCRTTPITKFQPGERPKTARRWMLLERGADGPALNFNTLLVTNEALKKTKKIILFEGKKRFVLPNQHHLTPFPSTRLDASKRIESKRRRKPVSRMFYFYKKNPLF